MLTGIVLAAGLSRRMGENKLLLPYREKPIFTYILTAIQHAKLDDFVVVTSHFEIETYCKSEKINTVFNKSPQRGQGHSIALGVKYCNPESDYIFFVADQPLLQTKQINQIVEFYQKNKNFFVIPKNKNTSANPKIFPNEYREELLSLSEDVRGSDIIKKYPHLVKYIEIDGENIFMDVDTPQDYQTLQTNIHS